MKRWNLTVILDGEMEEVGRGVFLIPQHVADVQVIDISCERKEVLIFWSEGDKTYKNQCCNKHKNNNLCKYGKTLSTLKPTEENKQKKSKWQANN